MRQALLWATLVWFFSLFLISNRVLATGYEDTDYENHPTVLQLRRAIRRGGLNEVAFRTDLTIGYILRVAVVNMKAEGSTWASEEADEIWTQWETIYKGQVYKQQPFQDIGSHKPLSVWLANTYNKIEKALGVEVCKALHLSDLKTINYCLPIVLGGHACDFPMDGVSGDRMTEWVKHFAKDGTYYGLVPVIFYWSCQIGCWVGTAGVGAFVCGIAASGIEYLVGNRFAPNIGELIWLRKCGTPSESF